LRAAVGQHYPVIIGKNRCRPILARREFDKSCRAKAAGVDHAAAYAERSMSQAEAVWRGDADIDALHTSVFQDLLSDMLTESERVLACTHLLFVIKNFERIGDHAANIAETIQFLILGANAPEMGPRLPLSANPGLPAVNSVLNRLGGDR